MRKTKAATYHPLRVAVVGHFQVGKSTLINCLAREPRAVCGDSTRATTATADEYLSNCGRVLFVDTPGVNAEQPHDAVAMREIERADAALLVTRSTRALEAPVLQLAREFARRRVPVGVVVNCWDDRSWSDGDPEKVNAKVTETIHHQLRTVGMRMLFFEMVNIEWAAAARQCLDKKRAQALARDALETGGAANSDLDKRSRFTRIESYFLPQPWDAFQPHGFEAQTLASKFVARWRPPHAS